MKDAMRNFLANINDAVETAKEIESGKTEQFRKDFLFKLKNLIADDVMNSNLGVEEMRNALINIEDQPKEIITLIDLSIYHIHLKAKAQFLNKKISGLLPTLTKEQINNELARLSRRIEQSAI